MSLAKSVQTEWDIRHQLKPIVRTRGIGAAVPELLSDVRAERNKLGPLHVWPSREQLGILLNTVAWRNRTLGVGLSAKPHGYNVPMPRTGIMIASDILHFQKENVLVDCLISAGERAEPTWEIVVHHNDPQRVWVAPVDHSLEVIAPPPPPPLSDDKKSDTEERIRIIEERLTVLSNKILELNTNKTNIETILAEYEISGKTSNTFGHQHNVKLSLERKK